VWPLGYRGKLLCYFYLCRIRICFATLVPQVIALIVRCIHLCRKICVATLVPQELLCKCGTSIFVECPCIHQFGSLCTFYPDPFSIARVQRKQWLASTKSIWLGLASSVTYTVYDCVFGCFSAKITVYTLPKLLDIHMVLANPTDIMLADTGSRSWVLVRKDKAVLVMSTGPAWFREGEQLGASTKKPLIAKMKSKERQKARLAVLTCLAWFREEALWCQHRRAPHRRNVKRKTKGKTGSVDTSVVIFREEALWCQHRRSPHRKKL